MLKPIVSADWLSKHIHHPDLVILDASIKKVTAKNESEYKNLQIKGTRFFDIKKTFSDQQNPIPNMLPSSKHFEENCRKLGINANSKIIIYDTLGIYSSARAWWMFTVMGHKEVAILDGGFPEWIRLALPTEAKTENSTNYNTGNFNSKNDRSKCTVTAKEVLIEMNGSNSLILDARSHNRFIAVDPEPRSSLKGGHIPNSINLPYTRVLDNGKMRSKEQLTQLFEEFNIKNKKLIFSCGSGITACIILLAAKLSGYTNLLVYDGSWSEWGQLDGVPIESYYKKHT
ncbi:sulfurtransferase [Aquimarina sp. RZ0]|nr:sulfurtransferase [Aquimarina sp. RZ0]